VGGMQSRELNAVGLGGTKKLVAAKQGNTLRHVEGPHLFPMERPLETAQMIHELVKLIEDSP
jgi:hypothetical protein